MKLVISINFHGLTVNDCLFLCSARIRPKVELSEEQLDSRDLIQKEWARYQTVQKNELHNVCLRLLRSQELALIELRKESEELYQAAIQPDDSMLPMEVKGPVYTAPIKNYESPVQYRLSLNIFEFLLKVFRFFSSQDGDYKDVSRKWK